MLRIDGVEQVAFDAPKGEYAAWFGNNATGLNPWDWCQLQVRSLEVEYSTTTPPGYDLIKKSMTKSQGINIPIGTPEVKKDPVRTEVSSPKSTSQGLDRLHLVFGTDVRQSAPVLLGSSDRIRLTGRSQKISTLPKTTFELAPQCDLPDFKPTEIALFVGGQRTRHEYLNPGATLPIFSFESSGDILDHTKLTVKAIDKKNRTVELMSVEVDSGATLKPDTLKMILNDERIEMMGAENAGGSTYLFLGHDYLGAIKGAGSASVDARRLPAGQYELFCVGTRSDGTVLPVTRNIVNISPRYQILSDESDGTAVLEGTKTSVTISVKRSAVAKISKTRLYAADRFVGANDANDFTIPIPLGDAPSGDVSIVLVGVGNDGTLYAPETISVRIKNPLHDAFIARDARASKLQQMLRKMSNFDQDVAYWYERAKQEPAFKTYMTGKSIYAIDEFGRMASLGYIESITIPGDPGRYLAECKAAVVRRAQHRLEIGQIQKLLGLRDRARGTFEQVIEEVGAKSGIGLAATQELMSL